MRKAAIIIANWNGKQFLKGCFDSILKQSYKNFEIYLVDNGSEDGSSDYVTANFPDVKLIQLEKNHGFAGGNNEGIEIALQDPSIEYLICLNNDTTVDRDWLIELIRTAENDKRIGAVQSKILLGDRKTIHATGVIINYDFSSTPRDFGKLRNYNNKEGELESAIGCSLLLTRQAIEKVGTYESFYNSYKEDDELCLKLRRKQFKIFYSPRSIVYHFHSQTFGTQSLRKIYLNERNRIFNLITFGSLSQILFSNIYTFRRILRQKGHLKQDKQKLVFKIKLALTFVKAYLVATVFLPKFLLKRLRM